MTYLVGTSGWQYDDWKGSFYPPDLPTSAWLAAYATAFPMVEVNNTFYRLPERSTFQKWADTNPDAGLTFVIKASRYLTHVKRLKDPEQPVNLLLDRAEPLRPRLGAVLLQLPPTMRSEPERLDATLAAFGHRRVRVAVEPRHPTWFVDEVLAVLRAHNAALCWTDRRGKIGPLDRTADWGYVRLHEGTASDTSYGDDALGEWAARLDERWPAGDVFAAFNNDRFASATRDARCFMTLLRRRGRDVADGPGVPTAMAAS